jgi:hypothetical protein
VCPAGAAVDPGPAPLRRLTRFEYNNTVRDLLGDATKPGDALPPEELGNGFGNDADSLTASRLLAERHVEVARQIAARATEGPKLATLVGCATTTAAADETCVKAFIGSFGGRAFRRPVEAVDADLYLALWKQVRAAGGSFDSAARAVIEAILQSPRFLYRIEIGEAPTANAPYAKVDTYELASRLSYFLWATMPDAALFEAARTGKLATRADVRVQAERMLKDPRAQEVLRYFDGVLFRLEGSERLQRSATEHPAFVGMAPLLKQESERFLDHVIWEGPGDLGTILSAPFTFMNAKIAKFYGVTTGAPTTDRLEKVSLDPAQRAGILTHSILLTMTTPGAHTNPTLRGVFVLERLLCAPPPDPPPSLNPVEPKYDPAQTTRERFAVHSNNAICSGCHQLIDPIGFLFENYDAVGRWRTKDNNKPIDAAAEVVGDVDVKGRYASAVELIGKLGKSEQARRCFVNHMFSFGYGRPETDRDRCSRASLDGAFAASGGKAKDLLIAMTQTDAFLYRPAPGR